MEFAITTSNYFISSDLNHPIIVNKTKKNSVYKYGYRDVHYDIEGWVDVNQYLPGEYDLCLLKTPKRTITGWHTGQSWDGLKLKRDEIVLYWKRLDEQKGN